MADGIFDLKAIFIFSIFNIFLYFIAKILYFF